MVRDDLATQLDRLTEAHTVHSMGTFGDSRGGFVDMDIERPEDLYALLDGPVLDCADVEVRPIMAVTSLSDVLLGLSVARA